MICPFLRVDHVLLDAEVEGPDAHFNVLSWLRNAVGVSLLHGGLRSTRRSSCRWCWHVCAWIIHETFEPNCFEHNAHTGRERREASTLWLPKTYSIPNSRWLPKPDSYGSQRLMLPEAQLRTSVCLDVSGVCLPSSLSRRLTTNPRMLRIRNAGG